MALGRQFIRADVKEIKTNVWRITMRYSYFSIYEFEEVFIESNIAEAIKKIAFERCHGSLQILDINGVVKE